MATPDERLNALGVDLPPPPQRKGLYVPVQVCGNLLYVSGHPPLLANGAYITGCVGADISREDGKIAARQTGLAILATLRQHLGGSLNRVVQVVKTLGMVNATPAFTDHPFVIDGYSELMKDVFGERAGVGARSAVGMGSLPFNIAVEIEVIVEIAAASALARSLPTLACPHYYCRGNAQATAATRGVYARDFPEVRPVINAIGSFTSLGGSRMDPAVAAAMADASQAFVDLNALMDSACRQVAQLVCAPVGYSVVISTGAAACLALAAAACLTKGQPEWVAQLPSVADLPATRVVVDGGSDTRWNQSMALTGASVTVLGSLAAPMTRESLTAVLCEGNVVAVVYFIGGGSHVALPTVIDVAHRFSVPVIVDAAAQLPPVDNLWRWTNLGADAVIFSGGKAIGGPQTSGFMVGRTALMVAARVNASPNEATVCRPMKCSKEDIVGLVTALRLFCKLSSDAGCADAPYDRRLASIEDVLRRRAPALLTGARRVAPGPPDIQPNWIPRLYIDVACSPHALSGLLGAQNIGASVASVPTIYGASVDHGNPLKVQATSLPTLLAARLARPDPLLVKCTNCNAAHHRAPVAVNTSETGIVINPQTINDEEALVVAHRVCDELDALSFAL